MQDICILFGSIFINGANFNDGNFINLNLDILFSIKLNLVRKRVLIIDHLLNHVQLAQHVQPLGRRCCLQAVLVAVAYILDVANPVVCQPNAGIVQRRLHATAAIVPTDNDMLDFQHVHSVLNR